MLLSFFGKKYLVVLPFQTYDASKHGEYLEVDLLWVMKFGTLTGVRLLNVNGKTVFTSNN